MKPVLKKILIGVGAVIGVVVLGGGGFVWSQTSGFDAAMEKVYDVPLPSITASQDPEVVARGKHLSASLGACSTGECHGTDLGGGRPITMGPLGTFTGPNITRGGLGAAYTDAELARLISHGVKKDGRSVRFMPVQDMSWLPDSDVTAIVSYVRSMPDVDRPPGPIAVGALGKILDQRDQVVLDVARRIAAAPRETAPPPAPTAEYGRFIAKLCTGCHGNGLSGGPIPGAPSSVPIPTNLTPHASGLEAWSYEDYIKLLETGVRKNGKPLDPFMPLEALAAGNEIERKALWAYLKSLPPTPFGNR